MRYLTLGLAVVWFSSYCFAEEIKNCECKIQLGKKLWLGEVLCNNISLSTIANVEDFDCPQKRNVTLSLNKLAIVRLKKLSLVTPRFNLSKGSIERLNQTNILTLLYLYGDHEDTIEVVTFTNLKDVEILNLSNKSLQYIDPDIFINNHKLRTVVLSNNSLVKISKTTSILNAPSVINLYLHNCMLRTINKHMFSKLKNLKHLDLSSNNLEVIPSNTFVGMHSLKFVEINGNRWKCDCRFQRLRDFVLGLMENTSSSDDSMDIEPVRCLEENEKGIQTWSEATERIRCDESEVTYCISKECGKKDGPTKSVVSFDKEVTEMIDCVDGCTPKEDCMTIKYGTPYVYLVAGGLTVVTAAVFIFVVRCWRKGHSQVSKLNENESQYVRNIRVAEEGNRKVTKSSSKVRLISVNSDPGHLNNQTTPVIPSTPVDSEQFSFN